VNKYNTVFQQTDFAVAVMLKQSIVCGDQ